MRAKGRFRLWSQWSGRQTKGTDEHTPHTQMFLWKHLIFKQFLPNLGQVCWQTVPGFRSSTHPPQMIFIKITPGHSRQTASSEQFTSFHLSNIFSYQKVKSRTISYRNVACWLTISKTPCLDSSKFFFMWPLVVLNNKKPSNLLLQKHCTPLTASAWVICTLCASKSWQEFYKH